MNALLNPLLDADQLPTLEPTLAVLFHTRSNALELVTSHRLHKQGNKAMLGPGQPLSPQDEQDVLRLLTTTDAAAPGPVTIFPSNLLHQDRQQIAWFVPGADRVMHFHTDKGRSQRTVAWPSLIFRVFNHDLFVVAVLGIERPDSTTALYKAPLPNIWANAQVCTGDAPLPNASMIEDLPAWEASFFGSAFSHQNDTEVVKGSRGFINPMTYWKSNKQPALTARNAVPLGCSLGQWLAETPDSARH